MKIPRDRLTIRFARSGGPGGQNVNRVETKVEVRFRPDEADWLLPPVRERLKELARGRITREGDLVVRSSRYRSQARNLEDCVSKLEAMIAAARKRRRRRVPTKPTRASKERRHIRKRQRSEKKSSRRWRPSRE